jgi:SulP family sulfate permease
LLTSISRAITGFSGGSVWRPLSPRLTGLTRGLRFDAQELSGGLGDIGVMVPIVATLIIANGFNPTSVLLVFGVTYVAAGLYFRIPMPVQPLKAMAAIAIAQGLSPEVVSAAGLVMAIVLLFLAWSSLMRPLSTLFSRPVVRGIQLGVGLLLVQSGIRLATSGPIVRGGPDFVLHAPNGDVAIALLVSTALLPLILLGSSRARIPFMLVLLPPSILLGMLASPPPLPEITPGPMFATPSLPNASTLLTALVVLVLPQLPLTLGNAVIASTDTARGYFKQASRVNHRSVLVSKGIANTAAGLLGGMPVCHGAGGLTAHYRFGARTGGATVMLGGILIVLALGFGSGAAHFFALIPLPVLAALLCLVGIQHSLLARDVRGWPERAIVIAIAGIGIASNNLAWGFLAGIAADQLLRLARRAFPLPSREELPVAAVAQSGS